MYNKHLILIRLVFFVSILILRKFVFLCFVSIGVSLPLIDI